MGSVMICPNSGHSTSPKPFVVCIACRQMVAVVRLSGYSTATVMQIEPHDLPARMAWRAR